MSYTIEKGDIVIKGFEQGISDDPYAGISDCRNINLISIPKEASVLFSTSQISPLLDSGTMTTSSAADDTVSLSVGTLATMQAIKFSVLSDATKGIALNTTYWVQRVSSGIYSLYSDYMMTALINITADSLTGTWATVNMGTPKYFNHFVNPYVDKYFMVDSNGLVWSNFYTVNGAIGDPDYWTYTGNTTTGTNGSTTGNGLVSYQPSDVGTTGIGYLFVFRDFQIDYATITSNASLVWSYGWKPSTGATGQNGYLKAYNSGGASIYNSSHEALVAPDNKIYYCDSNWIGRFYQASPTVGFLPGTPSTYVFDQTSVLPFIDTCQCLAPLGNSLLIGGKNNTVYPWDTFSQLPSYPILVAESNIVKMVTVNTNTYIFVGNRGRIYTTNGTNAQLYKKIPDYLSGTVEPYFAWGGVCSQKNQLYFSASVTKNSGASITAYGGLWAIDLDTKAIRMTNKLSYGTYAGYATAMIPNFGTNPAGTGLWIGWNSGASTYGIDTTSSNPYSSGQAYIDSDLIPIGTFLKPTTSGRVEFKLAVPLVANESIKIQYRQKFSDSFADIDANTLFNTAGVYSGVYQNVSFDNSQWIQLRAILTSTNSNPSYCRLTEIRLGN